MTVAFARCCGKNIDVPLSHHVLENPECARRTFPLAERRTFPLAEYRSFLRSKRAIVGDSGIRVAPDAIHPALFGFQRDLVGWALRKGRAAIFADTGLGKTFMQLEWARLTEQRTLILAPLTVARQTVAEARKLGMEIVYARRQQETGPQINITNYEMVDHFDPNAFGAVVLDESSILKAMRVTCKKLIALFSSTPYRLCCTATPAPNDIQELTNHSEFLGIMKRRDVLATFFLHDSSDARASGWRLKGHAREAFWRWLSSWGMSMKLPSDLGYPDDGYKLPPLYIASVIVECDHRSPGRLFGDRLHGITDRAAVRRKTAHDRVLATVDLIRSEPDEPWIAWCGLNDEARALAKRLGDEARNVEGAQSPEQKAEALEGFLDGQYRVLVTKPTVAGYGLNLQRCARMVFVGLGDSYEQYYQSIRRCWRFGQTREVRAQIVLSDPEQVIYENVMRKEREATEMARELVRHVAAYERAEIASPGRADTEYRTEETMRLPEWMGVWH